MSHHDPHHAQHDHPHQLDHSHGKSRTSSADMPLELKLVKLLEHWMAHNDDHANTYRQWSALSRERGFVEAAALIEEAARQTEGITATFKAALETIQSRSS